jgi:hypothetical protein
MVKRDVVISRLNKLSEYIGFLNKVKSYSKKEYIGDFIEVISEYI